MSEPRIPSLMRTLSIHDKEGLLHNYIMNGGPSLSYEVIKASGWRVLRKDYWEKKKRGELTKEELERCGTIDKIYIENEDDRIDERARRIVEKAAARNYPSPPNISDYLKHKKISGNLERDMKQIEAFKKYLPIGSPIANTSLAPRAPFKFQSWLYKAKKSVRKTKKSAKKSVRKPKKSVRKTKKSSKK
jgi:hypothetical protein